MLIKAAAIGGILARVIREAMFAAIPATLIIAGVLRRSGRNM